MYRYNKVLDAALVALMSYHLVISPYTKVEESFNIQAIHDILNYGILPENLQSFDHKQFPGVVPRTFIGSLILSALAKPLVVLLSVFGVDLLNGDQSNLQLLVRGILGLVNVFMLIRLRDAINRITFRDKKSQTKGLIGFWYMILLASQFHLNYYSSRTLPNFIALPFVNYAFSKLIVGDLSGLTWLAFTGIIFRLEVGLLGAIIAVVSSLVFGQSNIVANIVLLSAGTLFGGVASFAVDSYFWDRAVLPELSAFIFNVVEGESVKWGTEPWGAYFTKYLLQIFRPPVILILAVPGLIGDPAESEKITRNDQAESVGESESESELEPKPKPKSNPKPTPKFIRHPAEYSLKILFVSSILFIIAMSFQPHKEWRFIAYTIPIFTLQAANGLSNISMKWSLGFATKLLTVIITFMVLFSSILSIFLGYVSSFNYPGGEALAFANDYIKQAYPETNALVYLTVPACMTGVTRFQELHAATTHYTKEAESKVNLGDYDIIIVDEKQNDGEEWELLHTSKIFQGVSVQVFYKLMIAQKFDSSTIPRLVRLIIEDFLSGTNESLLTLLRSTIKLEDYLYVYAKRKEKSNLG